MCPESQRLENEKYRLDEKLKLLKKKTSSSFIYEGTRMRQRREFTQARELSTFHYVLGMPVRPAEDYL
jgi:hypothetical protein